VEEPLALSSSHLKIESQIENEKIRRRLIFAGSIALISVSSNLMLAMQLPRPIHDFRSHSRYLVL
jgi:hypothetical protein